MDRVTAVQLKETALTCTEPLDRSVQAAARMATQEQFHMYRRFVGNIMGAVFDSILEPVYRAYPDLETYRDSRESITEEFSGRLSSLLHEAISLSLVRLELLRGLVEQISSADLRADLLTGIAEVHTAILEAETFVGSL